MVIPPPDDPARNAMYHHTLHILLLSSDPLLEASLRAAAPRPGFAHIFSTGQNPESDTLAQCAGADIVLLDASRLEHLPAMRRAARPDALFIFAGDAQPEAESLPLLDDVWLGPASAGLYDFHVARLLDAVRQRRDHDLTNLHLNTVIDLTTDLVWFKDAKGAHVKVNEAFCRLVGKSREVVEGRGHYFIWDIEPEEYAQGEFVCLETDQIVMNSREVGVFDEVVKAPQGMRQFKTRKAPLFNADGRVMGTVGIARDVTDIANMTAELDLVLQSIPYAVMLLDADRRIVNFNDRFRKLFGITDTDYIIGEKREVFRKKAIERLGFARKGKHVKMRSAVDGHERFIDMYEENILDIFNNVIGMICIYRDVTRQRQIEKRLKERANTDELTGLFNRHYFFRQIPVALPLGAGLAYVDLDNFKYVNDKFGHDTGDKALMLTAQLLRKHLRGAVIARLGGDEFAAYLPEGCTEESLRTCASDLLAAMIDAYDAHEAYQGLSASIGVALVEDQGLSREDLVRRGDLAMYTAKRLGKRGYCFYTTSLE
ncbi:diguanylate cyclase [uncultured Desulfovibrio sp.]|uniref:diguanylate cyclase n=1 Tax=uncultured Desulfovibrio sp. TaxID=167968 RepID=UPI00286854EB|nr:diguanylate cyclase [uncultured Desulfovibrio sp.]